MSYRKARHSNRLLDDVKVVALKSSGLANSQIAQRLGVTAGAIYHALKRSKSEAGGLGLRIKKKC